jgi:hypothetical protein
MKGCFRLAMIALGICFAAVPAEAKTVHLGEFSRNSIKLTCARGDARAYGIDDETQQYGCKSSHTGVIVVCTIESDCFAIVSDTTPVRGNSLDVLLGIRRSGQPQRVEAVDSRIEALQPQP